MLASVPSQCETCKVERQVQSTNQSSAAFDCRPKHFLHEVGTRIEWEFRRERLCIGNSSPRVVLKDVAFLGRQIIGVEEALTYDFVLVVLQFAEAENTE